MVEAQNILQIGEDRPSSRSYSSFSVITNFSLIWMICILISIYSLNRNFGTDIFNYRFYFSDPTSNVSAIALGPAYVFTAHFIQVVGLSPEITIDLIAILTVIFIKRFVTKSTYPVSSIIIILSWILLQQIWGTIRMGLGTAFLLALDKKYIETGKFSKKFFLAPLFHWSLIVHPIILLIRISLIPAITVSILTFGFMKYVISVKNVFFHLIPASLSPITNYAILQSNSIEHTLSPLPLIIHLSVIIGIQIVCSRVESKKFIGPLTILYCFTALFYDFDEVAGRVANILIEFKILAMITIYNRADKFGRARFIIRPLILVYNLSVAIMYFTSQEDYFNFEND